MRNGIIDMYNIHFMCIVYSVMKKIPPFLHVYVFIAACILMYIHEALKDVYTMLYIHNIDWYNIYWKNKHIYTMYT